ncbi:TPA: hypothetical protein PXN94_004165 [Yersinia enterocolitica]|nr:hypothetical protein [Yersinia enterocolitica]
MNTQDGTNTFSIEELKLINDIAFEAINDADARKEISKMLAVPEQKLIDLSVTIATVVYGYQSETEMLSINPHEKKPANNPAAKRD